jgi:hypothetical protein
MIRNRKLFFVTLGSTLLLALGGTIALAQDPVLLMPMFSIEAFEVNSVPIKNGPTAKITVAPGDVITAKILIRNWSPQGQKLRGYQAKMDPAGYKSGTTGTVHPWDIVPVLTTMPMHSLT